MIQPDDVEEAFQSVRSVSERSIDYSSYLLKASPFAMDSYYNYVTLDGIKGTLKLDVLGIVFSPENQRKAQRSWSWSVVEKHHVRESVMQIKVIFKQPPTTHQKLPVEPVIFTLEDPDELLRIKRDLFRRIKRSFEDKTPPQPSTSHLNTTTNTLTIPEPVIMAPPAKESAPLMNMESHTAATDSDEPTSVEQPIPSLARTNHSLKDIPGNMVQSFVTRASSTKSLQLLLRDERIIEERETALTEDIYSLLFTGNPFGMGFWFGAFTFGCQISVLLQIFLDLVDLSDDPPLTTSGQSNRLQIPAGVDATVTIAQFIGVFMTINFLLDGGDLIKGFDTIANGYWEDMIEQCPHATRPKWLLAGMLQAFSGSMMLLNLFILSMQSTSVITFCLNFAALHFVQELDDVAFSVGSKGLFSKRIQAECLAVGDITIPVRVRKRTLWMRRILIVFLFFGLYTGFFVLMGNQWSGTYRCDSVYVQFGDAFGAELSFYSGIFMGVGGFAGRPTFVHESKDLELFYSKKEKAWLFRWTEKKKQEHIAKGAGCLNDPSYLIKSSYTDTYDVVTVADQVWYANMQGGEKPMDWLALVCADCSESLCLEERGKCVSKKFFTDGTGNNYASCECNPDQMGLFCEIERGSCNSYEIDYRSTADLHNFKGGSFFLESAYGMVQQGEEYTAPDGTVKRWSQTITVYDRGIYFHTLMHSVIVFSGRRWIMFGQDKDPHTDESPYEFNTHLILEGIANMTSIEALKAIQEYHGFKPLYFSDPMDYNTPTEGVDFTNLDWWNAIEVVTENNSMCADFKVIEGYNASILGFAPGERYKVKAQFQCSDCYSDDDCQSVGRCSGPGGSCTCQDFYDGPMCEQTRMCTEVGCLNGGLCDVATGVCRDCGFGSDGNLCQYPLPDTFNPFFCSEPKIEWVDPLGQAWPRDGKCANFQRCNGLKQKCECEAPFFGEACINATQPTCFLDSDRWTDPCANGGYCDRAKYSSYPICVCPHTHTGPFCEEEVSP